jgi:hypothetical protein
MKTRAVSRLLLAALVAAAGMAAAADAPKPLYSQTIAKYPAPKLADVGGREYKFLIDPAKAKGTPEEAFKAVWTQVKAAAAKNGFTVTEKDKSPLKLEMSTKEYFDTPEQALWSKGYLVRITTKYKDGKPDETVSVTVKAILDDATKTLATPLAVEGLKAKTEAEGNVGPAPGGGLVEIIEKGSTFSVKPADLGAMTLGDFGKFMPELVKLGLPGTTKLVGTKAWSYRVRPGAVVLPGVEPCAVSMEGWAAKEGGAPYLYDFSYGFGDVDFYAVAETHAAGEQFLLKVVMGELSGLAMPDGASWGGSKVRKLMNRPVGAKPLAAASAPSLDKLYGVASQPAYVKHYEADKTGKVILNPYLQMATKDFPAILDVKQAPYNWVIDTEGRVAVAPEAAHPLGRTYEKGFYRPEDQSQRKPGTRENFGHVSELGGAPGRISGEILYDKASNTWTLNNKSGRYSKHNTDRTPDQLVNAANLVHEVVDPGTATWGNVYYLLAYAPEPIQEELLKSPKLGYDDEKTKSRPNVMVMAAGAPVIRYEKPFEAKPAETTAAKAADKPAEKQSAPADAPKKTKKPKAAINDDPS